MAAVEYKVNFLAAAVRDKIVTSGQVIRPGQNITVCQGAVVARTGNSEKLVAIMQATMMAVRPQSALTG